MTNAIMILVAALYILTRMTFESDLGDVGNHAESRIPVPSGYDSRGVETLDEAANASPPLQGVMKVDNERVSVRYLW